MDNCRQTILAFSSFILSITPPPILSSINKPLFSSMDKKSFVPRTPRRPWTAEEDDLLLSLRQQDPDISASQFSKKYQSSFTERTPLAIRVRLADMNSRARMSQGLTANANAQGSTWAAIPAKRPGEDDLQGPSSQRTSMGPAAQYADNDGEVNTGAFFENTNESSPASSDSDETQSEETPVGDKVNDTDSIGDWQCFTDCGCTEADSDFDREIKDQAGSENDTDAASAASNANVAPTVGASGDSKQGAPQNKCSVAPNVGSVQSGSTMDSTPASALDRLASAAASQQAAPSQPSMGRGVVNPLPVRPAQQGSTRPTMSQARAQTRSTLQCAPAPQLRARAPFFGTSSGPVQNMTGAPGPSRQTQGVGTAAPPTSRARARTTQQPQVAQRPINPGYSNNTTLPHLPANWLPDTSFSPQQQLSLVPGPHPWLRQLAGIREPIGFRAATTMLNGLVREFAYLKNTYYTHTSNQYQDVSERCGSLAHELQMTKLQLDSTKAGLLRTNTRLENDLKARNERIHELENEVARLNGRILSSSEKALKEAADMKDPEARLLMQAEEIQQLGETLRAREKTIATYEKILTGSAGIFSEAVEHNQNKNKDES
ncbi:hypothetical protein ASPVEDRAFT_894495 [Aspergillus versicolor CBS 583.65]|uniref:Myb-like domain-containing protein n=1 Tax=Aspergillus versicolor CBS 583.65 TaxID=1036611 RepID=A0A1L9PVL3_ASPVE|nr:uncharacterized protein ASPVEDRAFT_894495 [Aspergillus versicolor CBS 583.65]OJJ05590.1 hypothetical protein ASPVEDRAFT_894495 [Aspergillus versicolor CBS 583.65]